MPSGKEMVREMRGVREVRGAHGEIRSKREREKSDVRRIVD